MSAIKQRVETGQYHVDTYLVADAIINRMVGALALPASLLHSQNECSKPASSSSASRNDTPGGPSTTDPIQVSPTFAPKRC
jgi:hypothetical protein